MSTIHHSERSTSYPSLRAERSGAKQSRQAQNRDYFVALPAPCNDPYILTLRIIAISLCLFSFGCTGPADRAVPAPNLDTIKLGMAAFQDFNSIWVGVKKGIFEKHRIHLDIVQVDQSTAMDLFIGGRLDLAPFGTNHAILMTAQGIDATVAFPFFIFAGGGFMYDPERFPEWKTYATLMAEKGADTRSSLRTSLGQIRGRTIGTNTVGGEFITFKLMVEEVGLALEDFKVIDLTHEELPAALIANSIDVMISGIPQRMAVLKEGYATLIDQTALPSTIAVGSFGTSRKWVDEHPDLARRFQKALFETLDYIDKNRDDSFPIISRHMRDAGSRLDAEDMNLIWNNMEIFITTPEMMAADLLDPKGKYYWKDRFEKEIVASAEEGMLDPEALGDRPLEDLYYAARIFKRNYRE